MSAEGSPMERDGEAHVSPSETNGADADADDLGAGSEVTEAPPEILTTADKLATSLRELQQQLHRREELPVSMSGSLEIRVNGAEDKRYKLSVGTETEGVVVRMENEGEITSTHVDVTASPETKRQKMDLASDERHGNGVAGQKRKRSPEIGSGGTSEPAITAEATSAFLRRLHAQHQNPAVQAAIVNLEQTLASAQRDMPAGQPANNDQPQPAEAVRAEVSNADLLRELKRVQEQINWLEQCRRRAQQEHDQKEDKWYTTSATFQYQVHGERTGFERWMVPQVDRQNRTLGFLENEMRGLRDLVYSLKWDTPTSVAAPSQATYPTARPSQARNGRSTASNDLSAAMQHTFAVGASNPPAHLAQASNGQQPQRVVPAAAHQQPWLPNQTQPQPQPPVPNHLANGTPAPQQPAAPAARPGNAPTFAQPPAPSPPVPAVHRRVIKEYESRAEKSKAQATT